MLQLGLVTSLAKSSLPAQAPTLPFLCLSVLQPRQSKKNGVPRPARLQLETSTRPRPVIARDSDHLLKRLCTSSTEPRPSLPVCLQSETRHSNADCDRDCDHSFNEPTALECENLPARRGVDVLIQRGHYQLLLSSSTSAFVSVSSSTRFTPTFPRAAVTTAKNTP